MFNFNYHYCLPVDSKPCPFCGSHDISADSDFSVFDPDFYVALTCNNCLAQGPALFLSQARDVLLSKLDLSLRDKYILQEGDLVVNPKYVFLLKFLSGFCDKYLLKLWEAYQTPFEIQKLFEAEVISYMLEDF